MSGSSAAGRASYPSPRFQSSPPVATRCPDLLDAFANGWFVRQWVQEIVVPASNATAASGAESSSRERKLLIEGLAMTQAEAPEQDAPKQEAPEQKKPAFDVEDITGKDGVFNTETGPVAVVHYPHLTRLLSTMGLEYITNNPAINIDTTIENLSPDVQRALLHAAMSANDIVAPAPPACSVQNENSPSAWSATPSSSWVTPFASSRTPSSRSA